ncbi:aldo/keto reductase [Staphylococcus simiae]|uniref:aldo/keto reductase n=1 Tax=Staphylococcus simiae TaxID=308354 RepID=UPI001A95BCB6|nr:aldo/keto reductase [Staphylococcus simiae]MBO1199216.1 aldo/keto reductase [Staphylococcus simiae]MBO1201381.1 aldo/keto reductase [Staphylococcus simiae]MBO1203565.1 aldo/keto reductase [Staphylococcus simiae]MBO1211188.1 aldo/keto reductase [Staphylococcus simiae]MBO1229755.1 aldo/keto reductase [Staphylococcus simiae]
MQYKKFYNGNSIPQVGLGTFRVENNDDCKEAVKFAIEEGYRSIDTAKVYGNEEKVGEGIRLALESTGLKREDLFITSKLYFEDFGRENVQPAYQASLDRLGLDYLDLYLMHWPGTNEAVMINTWKGMEDLYKNSQLKNIGVSNFETEHLEALLAQVSFKPVINQVECHPYLNQHKLRHYLEAQHIVMESWSPLMNAQILCDDTIQQIAQRHRQSAAQIIIRWNVQHGIVTIPKSVTPNRIIENINVFDFELTNDEMTQIDNLNKDQRIGPDPKIFEG